MQLSHIVKPQGFLGRLGDLLMLPIMFLIQGTLRETPQRTHFWNNLKIKDAWTVSLLRERCYFLAFHGDPTATPARFFGLPLMHLRGWKTFKVIEPLYPDEQWFVGWYQGTDIAGISKIPLTGPVRVLIGPGEVSFFALNAKGNPLPLRQIGAGRINSVGAYAKIPLL